MLQPKTHRPHVGSRVSRPHADSAAIRGLLALVLLAVGGLLILTGALRATAQILARKAPAPEPAVAPAALARPHSGAHARPRRTRSAPRRDRRHSPRRSAPRRARS